MAYDPNQGAMQGLGMWPGLQYASQAANPAMQYQSQVGDRRIPAIEQTWGPFLDAMSQNSQGNMKLRAGPGGPMQGPATGMPQIQTPQSVTPHSVTPQGGPMAGLQQALPRRKTAQDTEADNYYQQKYPGVA